MHPKAARILPWWRRRKAAWTILICVVVLALAVAGLLLLLLTQANSLADRYLKPRLERAFAKANPAAKLSIDKLNYAFRGNTFTGQNFTFKGSNGVWTCQIASASLAGVPWWRIPLGKRDFPTLLASSSWDLRGLKYQNPAQPYVLSCEQLRLSLPEARMTAYGTESRPAGSDDEFFEAHAFRRIRMIWKFPEVSANQLNTEALLHGKGFYARQVQVTGASLDTLSSKDKPLNPQPKKKRIGPERLFGLPFPFAVQHLRFTNSAIRAGARLAKGKETGYLTFTSLQLDIDGLSNSTETNQWLVSGHTRFMDEGVLKLRVQIPTPPRDLSFTYSGSLGRVDLTRLNPFLVVSARTRLEAGVLHEANFEAEVKGGHALGVFRGAYENMDLAFIDRETGSEKGIVNRLKSLVADHIIVRTSNMPQDARPLRTGKIDYTCRPNEQFFHFMWFGVRSGMLDLLGLSDYVKAAK